MTLQELVSPVAQQLFSGEGEILSQPQGVRVAAPLGGLLICFTAQRGRVVVSASLRNDLGGSYYHRDLNAVTPKGERMQLRRTFAPDRFSTHPNRVLNEVNRHIAEPALPLAFKALAALADHHNKKRSVSEVVERIAPSEAVTDWDGNFHLRKAITAFDPSAYGSIEIRPDTGYCQMQIRNISMVKIERLVKFLNGD